MTDMEEILTASFRKVMGHCPIADRSVEEISDATKLPTPSRLSEDGYARRYAVALKTVQGMSQIQIAQELGCQPQLVSRDLKAIREGWE